jgi:hypothetical protein
MAAQSAASHTHHPIPTYIATVLWAAAAVDFVGAIAFDWKTRDNAMGFLLAAVLFTISIGRAYTVKLQDRIIMLEMKVRAAEVLPAGEDAKLAQLSAKQIAALRFASDDELGALLDRAVREKLSTRDIKQAIQRWRPDPHRT